MASANAPEYHSGGQLPGLFTVVLPHAPRRSTTDYWLAQMSVAVYDASLPLGRAGYSLGRRTMVLPRKLVGPWAKGDVLTVTGFLTSGGLFVETIELRESP